MGTLILPTAGLVYVDTQVVIYAVQPHALYGPLLQPLWQAVAAGTLVAATSELTLMETLVAPLRNREAALVNDYETFLTRPGMRLIPITRKILREAAALRASMPRIKTPDAIHLATAARSGASLLVTNDHGLRAAAGVPMAVLSDVLVSPST